MSKNLRLLCFLAVYIDILVNSEFLQKFYFTEYNYMSCDNFYKLIFFKHENAQNKILDNS